MDDHVDMSDGDRATLEFATIWMLSAVVGRYRGFNQRTLEALDAVLATAGPSNGLAYDLVLGVRGRLPKVVAEFELDSRPIVSGLSQVEGLLERRPTAEAEAVRRLLVDTVGMGIARARGPFGAEATREDAARLEFAASILAPMRPFGWAFEAQPAEAET